MRIPRTFVPQPLKPGQPAKQRATCGHCGRSWDDGVSTGRTPTPSGRCPFEDFHDYRVPRTKRKASKSPDQIAVERGFQTLTMVEFSDADHEAAERMAKRLGFTQTAYTTTSALWGLFCLPDRATQRRGCIVKTRELGMLYVQDAEDLLMKGA